jgi:hypothetical protein
VPIEIKITREELGKRKVMLGVPMYGGNCAGIFCRSALDLAVLLNHWGVGLQLYFLFNESLITRARNYIADEFMRSDCTHLMFIDSDIGFNPQDVMAMLALSKDDSDYDVLCGPYAKKCISWEKIKQAVDKGIADKDPNQLEKYVGDFVFNPLNGGSIKISEPAEVLESGTGFMLIRRAAFEKLRAARPDLLYRPDHVRTAEFDGTREIMAYFMDPIDKWNREKLYKKALEKIASGDYETAKDLIHEAKAALEHQEEESRRLLSEDYFFCQELRKAGGKVWLLPWMKLQHVGSYVFGGSLADLASIGASATADVQKLEKIKKNQAKGRR